MAIGGLQRRELNIGDHVGANVDALDRLGLLTGVDRERVTKQIAADFASLSESGLTGEPYIWLPKSMVDIFHITRASDNGIYGKSRKTYPNTDWGVEKDDEVGISNSGDDPDDDKELGQPSDGILPHGRLAVYNPASSDYDPFLHFFDGLLARAGEEGRSQPESLRDLIERYKAAHPEFNMGALSTETIALIGLVRRIKRKPMPVVNGVMRDYTRTETVVDGTICTSLVGYHRDGQMYTGWSRVSSTKDHPGEGFGISVGPVQSKP